MRPVLGATLLVCRIDLCSRVSVQAADVSAYRAVLLKAKKDIAEPPLAEMIFADSSMWNSKKHLLLQD